MNKIREEPEEGWVVSYFNAREILKCKMSEIDTLVKYGILVAVESLVFKFQAITKESIEAYLNTQQKELLGAERPQTICSLCHYGKFTRIKDGHFNKMEVLKYKKEKEKDARKKAMAK